MKYSAINTNTNILNSIHVARTHVYKMCGVMLTSMDQFSIIDKNKETCCVD